MTELSTQGVRGESIFVRRFEVTVVAGADRGASAISTSDEMAVGTAEGNALRLTDPAVSRHHCTLRTHERGLEVRDHGSRNGTLVGDSELVRGFVRSGARITIGHTTLEVRVLDQELEQPLAATDRYGGLLGASAPMRRLYTLLAHCASSDGTVLVTGETGTGKELIAEAIHDHGRRAKRPLVVVDGSALSHELAESELFGHERGAFTGAEAARVGAFEHADGGTIFLDEVGELPLSLQPKLLRVLESKEVRRIGATAYRTVDVRVIAATHRDLRAAVNDKRFRADLYYRLDVLRVDVPPLRERGDDVRMLAAQFWTTYRPELPPPEAMLAHLAELAWPGNVRELRNAIERAALLGWSPTETRDDPATLTYQQAKVRAVWTWEHAWLERLLDAHTGNLSAAARATHMGRSHLRELARRHGFRAAADNADDEGHEES